MRDDQTRNSKETGMENRRVIECSSNTLQSGELQELLSITDSQLRLSKDCEIEMVLRPDEYNDETRGGLEDLIIAFIPVICVKISESLIKDFVNFLYVSAKNKFNNRKKSFQLKIISRDGHIIVIDQKTDQKVIDDFLSTNSIVKIDLDKKEE